MLVVWQELYKNMLLLKYVSVNTSMILVATANTDKPMLAIVCG